MNTEISAVKRSDMGLMHRPLAFCKIQEIQELAEMGIPIYRVLWEASKVFVPASRVALIDCVVECDRTISMRLSLHEEPHLKTRSFLQQLYIIDEGSGEKKRLARYSIGLRPELTASVSPHAENETCLDLAKTWLEECCREHRDCGTRVPTCFPSRLLEIGKKGSSRVYLREVRGQMGSYAALSYCWGSSASRLKILCNALKVLQRRRNDSANAMDETSDLKSNIEDFDVDGDKTDLDEFKRLFNLQRSPDTVFNAIKMASSTTTSAQRDIVATKSNIDELKRGFDIQRLPRTVLDAVKIARHLSIQYIWVDRLCIIQDDPDDWARESRSMWAVFANALLTISADRSPDVTSGIFHEQAFATWPRKEIQIGDIKTLVQPKMPHPYARQELHRMCSSPKSEPVDCRAWCFQENLASTRLLHYGFGEMLWECKERTLCECGRCQVGGYRRDSSFLTRLQSDLEGPKVYQRWFDAVMAYSSRVMTREKDKLPALSGVASKTHDQIIAANGKSDTYLAGLWGGDIARGLLWSYTSSPQAYCYRLTKAESPAGEYRAPTWSWASVDCPVYWWHGLGDKFNSAVTIIDARAIPKTDSNPYGEVNSAYILLSGPTYQGLTYLDLDQFRYTLKMSGISITMLEIEIDKDNILRQGAVEVVLLYVGTACGQGSLQTVHYYLILRRSLRSAKFHGPLRFGMLDHLPSFNRPYERIGFCASSKVRHSSASKSNGDGENDGAEELGISWHNWRHETLYLV